MSFLVKVVIIMYLQCANDVTLRSSLSSKMQSSMTTFNYIDVGMKNTPNFVSIIDNYIDEQKVSWDDSIVVGNVFTRRCY